MDETERLKELAASMRFYGDMRFKLLTLLVAWLTLSVGGLMQFGGNTITDSIYLKHIIAPASILFTSTLWIMEIKSTLYWVANREKALVVWPAPEDPKMKHFNSTNAVVVFYASVFLFWLYLSFIWHGCSWVPILGTVFYVSLLLLTYWNYKSLWCHQDKK